MVLFRIFGYLIRAECGNCGDTSEIRIPRGITITEYLSGRQARCPNCGCNQLKKKISRVIE